MCFPMSSKALDFNERGSSYLSCHHHHGTDGLLGLHEESIIHDNDKPDTFCCLYPLCFEAHPVHVLSSQLCFVLLVHTAAIFHSWSMLAAFHSWELLYGPIRVLHQEADTVSKPLFDFCGIFLYCALLYLGGHAKHCFEHHLTRKSLISGRQFQPSWMQGLPFLLSRCQCWFLEIQTWHTSAKILLIRFC